MASGPRSTFGVFETARLWLSYQRYAFLMFGVPAAGTAAIATLWPHAWWVWGPAALITLKLWAFAVTIWQRWPYKRTSTLRYQRQIDAGRFDPERVRRFTGDPCFRVVAREVLRRADVRGPAQAALIARLRAEHEAAGQQIIFVDRAKGEVIHVDGLGTTRSALQPPAVNQPAAVEGISNGR